MKKYVLSLLFLVGICAAFLPVTVSAAPAAKVVAPTPQTSLSVTVTSVKGSVVKVSTPDRKVYTLAFAAKVSFVDEKGKNLTLKQMHIGDSLRIVGTLKGSTFTVARGRRASGVATPGRTP